MNGGSGDDDVTFDTLLRGRVKLIQPARGFRSSLDPVLLSGFVASPYGRFLDIGCGTGALAFLLLARDPLATGVGVEIQTRLAALAARGLAMNDFGARLSLLNVDARSPGATALASRAFDLVVTNPPFFPVGEGVLPPDQERRVAHHEVSLALPEWLDVAVRCLAPGGRIAAIYPAERGAELKAAIAARGLVAIRTRDVLPRAGQPPSRILIEARRERAATVIEPPLVVHESGDYTDDLRRLLGE